MVRLAGLAGIVLIEGGGWRVGTAIIHSQYEGGVGGGGEEKNEREHNSCQIRPADKISSSELADIRQQKCVKKIHFLATN